MESQQTPSENAPPPQADAPSPASGTAKGSESRAAPGPFSMSAHPTVWTVILTIVLAAVLSLLPLPESLRPFPFREKGVGPTLAAALFPQGRRKSLDEIRHENLPPPKSTQPAELSDLLLPEPMPAAGSASASSSSSDGISGSLPAASASAPVQTPENSDAGTSLRAESPSVADGGTAPLNENAPASAPDPAFWLTSNSAPPLAWLSAGAKETKDFTRIEATARQLGASHRDIEEACLDGSETPSDAPVPASAACRRRSLDPFFEAIGQVTDGTRTAPIRIAHFGNSLIASDFVAATIRRELSERYGSGGQGFLLVDRPTRMGNFDRTGRASEGWKISLLTDKGPRLLFGLTGARFGSGKGERQTVAYDLKGSTSADIFWLSEPGGGSIAVTADGTEIQTISTQSAQPSVREPGVTSVKLPQGSRRLELSTKGGAVTLYGVSLENGLPGIVHDTYGLAGGTADVFMQADAAIFGAQLKARNPTLVLIMLGGNEAYEMSRGWMSLDKARKTTAAFFARIRSEVPEAACLAASPLDAGIRSASGNITPRPFAEEVRDMMRAEALKAGCAFWDMQGVMGGVGAAARWFHAGAMNEDLIHPRAKGAEVLGHFLVLALEKARLTRRAVADDIRHDPPGIGQPGRLAGFFGKLAALESKARTEPVSVVQIGASHTAAHFFADEARLRFTGAFGGAGRGFIAAGRPSQRLANAGVERTQKGSWKVADAREEPPGGIFGLTGIRAEGQPGAVQGWRFGIGEKKHSRKGVLTLHWLDAPGIEGSVQLKLDGKALPPLTSGAPEKPVLRLHKVEVTGPAHALEAVNETKGPVSLFGLSLDFDAPGVRWDALGLPGATSMLADTFDKEAFRTALADRKSDLLVLFYGTNEAALADLDAGALTASYRSLIQSFKAASPETDCLIIGPTDRLAPDKGPQAIAPAIDLSNDTIREVARLEECAFWSSRRAMGGTRSMKRWQEAGLGHKDGVHLTPKGYKVLADALADALLREFAVWKDEASKSGSGSKD